VGRPLNKKYLGNPTKPGMQVMFSQCWFQGEHAPSPNVCYVKRQLGTGRYQAEDSVTGTIGPVRLVGPAAPLEPGQAIMFVHVFNQLGIPTPPEHAKVIYNRTVKTWEDHQYEWSIIPASQVGQANLPMA